MIPFETDSARKRRQAKDGCAQSVGDRGSAPEGVYPVCKPAGVSSFRMVQLVRRLAGVKKVGHTGTLDPFASGVLIICVGRPATRLIPQLMEGDKEYVATLRLGLTTDTQDPEGNVTARRPVPVLNQNDIDGCLHRFTGELLQTPPAYSAVKHRGKPLYYYARRGIEVVKEPRPVLIKELECLELHGESLQVKVVCSKGTYIRTLAADIGEYLGCGAYVSALQRTRNGFFSLAETLPGEELSGGNGGTLLDGHRIPVAGIKELLAGTGKNN